MGGKGKTPPAPDYKPIAEASRESAEIAAQVSREQLAWAKEEFAYNKDLLERILDTQLPIMEREAEEGQRLRERYNEVFQPIEDSLIREAAEYATGARADFDAGRAMTSVGQAFDAARSNALARMESYGVDPSQTRSAALDAGIRVQEAAAKAAAGTQSRLNTENVGRAMRSEAINIGRGLPGNIASAYGTAMQAGQTGLGGALQTTASGANTIGTGAQWAGVQQNALGTWSNALSSQQAGQMQAANAKNAQSGQMGSAIGSIAGMAIGTMIAPGVGTALGGALGSAAGGAIASAKGGRMPDDPADPEGKRDLIEARLSAGEFVIPASAVRRLGSDHFDRLIVKHGDAEDRRAALHRLRTGAPGGEPAAPLPRRRALRKAA